MMGSHVIIHMDNELPRGVTVDGLELPNVQEAQIVYAPNGLVKLHVQIWVSTVETRQYSEARCIECGCKLVFRESGEMGIWVCDNPHCPRLGS